MPSRTASVQWKIMARQLPLLALVFLVVLYFFGEHLRGILLEADLEVARQSSRLTVSAVQATMESERTHDAWSRVMESIPLGENTDVEVLNAEGRVLYATEPSLVGTTRKLTDAACVVCHEDGSRKANA